MSERDLKDSLKSVGYSLEEIWFHNHNQELLEDLREKIDSEAKKPGVRGHLRLIEGGRSEKASEADVSVSHPSPVKKSA